MTSKVKQVIKGVNAQDGAGVKLVRVLGKDNVVDFDPFLLMDSFDSTNPEDYIKGFPMHPHRGIETLTYLIYGEMDHQDTLGNEGKIIDGSAQWMTAGSGIEHQEMPQPTEKILGIQLWINLPKDEKMTSPKYFDVLSQDIPSVKLDEGTVKVLSGEAFGVKGVTPHHLPVDFYDVELREDKEITIPKINGKNAFIFLIKGDGEIQSQEYKEKSALLLDDSDSVTIKAINGNARILFIQGPPLDEPIAWAGPIVMNTSKEIQQAYLDLRNGEFIKEDAK